jgi:hypothetical protein
MIGRLIMVVLVVLGFFFTRLAFDTTFLCSSCRIAVHALPAFMIIILTVCVL